MNQKHGFWQACLKRCRKGIQMAEVKRVLWVDDYPNNKAKNMFADCETKKVSTMEEAINEISGEHLYDYDTIVLDIDFENGLPKGETKVIEELSKKIYLNKDQRNKNFIINNGGYLLYLYLLEKGYPSEQVAFLTGNAGIIGQLKAYTNQNMVQMSKEEIAEAFITAWQEAEDDLDAFEASIVTLPIDKKYKDSDFLWDCGELLDTNDIEELKRVIGQVTPSMVTGSIQNTGDMMIFRFHEANLESPVYFSKNDNDIDGHNCADAEKWLQAKRTGVKVTRWLLLDAATYVERLFRKNFLSMDLQMRNLFVNVQHDPGIRSAFRQMFFVFDGLRNTERRGIYYQAVSAMLIPFDSNPQNSGPSALAAGMSYDKVQKMFARFSKQARNYCAHNYLGSAISNETVLFILMGTMSGILDKNQRKDIDDWYKNTKRTFAYNKNYSLTDNIAKVDQLYQNLRNGGHIDIYNAHVENITSYSNYTPWDLLRGFGYNTSMSVVSEQSTTAREKYFMFTLAAYVIKWFEGLTEAEVNNKYGKGIELMFRLSNEIVADYTYPKSI